MYFLAAKNNVCNFHVLCVRDWRPTFVVVTQVVFSHSIILSERRSLASFVIDPVVHEISDGIHQT